MLSSAAGDGTQGSGFPGAKQGRRRQGVGSRKGDGLAAGLELGREPENLLPTLGPGFFICAVGVREVQGLFQL